MLHVYLCVYMMNKTTHYIQKMRLPQVLLKGSEIKHENDSVSKTTQTI